MAEVLTCEPQFPSDTFTMRAFLARPNSGTQSCPAVVVIQEWWGLNEHIKDIARRLAHEGYVAVAPDLYSRLGHKVTGDPDEAARLMNALSAQAALRDLNATTHYLQQQSFVDPQRIGAIGFCMGGTFALTMACHNSNVKASIPFYGKVPPIESLNYLLCPVLYHYGAQDGWVTKQEVERLREGLQRFGKPGEVIIYPEASHAFFNDTRADVYRQQEARQAWQRSLQFLAQHLR